MQICQNNGIPIGKLALGTCECNCTYGYSGDNCEIILPCLASSNGETCKNGGVLTGSLINSDCSCECLIGFSG